MKKVRFYCLFAVLSLAFFMWGCDGGWKDRSETIDGVWKNKTEFSYLDSLTTFAADSAGVECESFSCRKLTIYVRNSSLDTVSTNDPLTILIEEEIDSIYYEEHYITYRWASSLMLDIYNCNTVDCRNADKIVLHNEDYSYSVLLKQEDFAIKNLGKKDIHYYKKGDFYLKHLFNLKVDVEGVQIDWDIQMGHVEYTEWEHYHIVPILG